MFLYNGKNKKQGHWLMEYKTKNDMKNRETFATRKTSNYRKVIDKIISNPPNKIDIGDWDDKGDLTFSVSMKEIGLDYSDYHKFENEIFSYFIIDFMGELLVRENIELFVEKLKEYDVEDYINSIRVYGSHKRFGVKTQKGTLIFKFHVSFIKNVISEDLRESLG